MNNLNSILDYLKVFNNINKRPAYEPRTMVQEPRNMYSQGQLVRNTVDGSRPGYNGKLGQPRKFDLEAVEKAINSANSKFKYTNLDDLAKQIDGVSSASHLEGIIKRQSLPKLDSHAIKAEKAFIELFKDSTRNADEVIKPLHKIAEMMGMYEGKERVRIDSITNALKKSKVLNYAEDVKPLINKLSSANFIIKIENAKKKKEPWRIKDVQSSIRTKSHLKAPKTDAENLMNYVVRHQDQAGKDAVFNIFNKKSGEIITDKSQIDSYHDIIFKDSKGKPYDMDYLLRNGKTDPMFKEYFDIQEKLKDMQGKKHWPDGSKIIDHTGKHVTFGNYSGSMYTHGYGYKKPYARFPYETDHLNLKKHPFKNLTILPQRINVAIGAADRLKKPDIKYKIGGEHFRNLSIDDLMMQEKALGKKILIFDAEGNHIGKTFKNIKNDIPNAWRGTTPYKAAEIKALTQGKAWNKAIKSSKAKMLAKTLELAGIDICSSQLAKAGGGRIGFAEKVCGMKYLEQNEDAFMRTAGQSDEATKLFKSGNIAKHLMKAKNWAKSNMGPAGWIGGELLIMGLGSAWDMSQGKGWKEAVDNWTGLGGHFGQAEARLKEIGLEQGYNEEEINEAMKIGQLIDLSTEAEEKQSQLNQVQEQQDIGGTARVKYSPNLVGTYKPIQGKYQDPKRIRDLKTDTPKLWEKGDELYESLKDYNSSVGLYSEMNERKKREEYDEMMKLRSKPRNYSQQFDVSSLDAPEYKPWDPYKGAEGGIASLRKKKW